MKCNKILLALQFWSGDAARAYALARHLADLEDTHCEWADFMFCSRKDCEIERRAVYQVARKFNVTTFRGRRDGVGWPHGCNDLWFDTMTFVWEQLTLKKFPQYKAILTIEADCIPMRKDWIRGLSRAWDKNREKGNAVPDLLGAL